MATKKPPKHESITFVENLKRQWMATVDAMVDPLMLLDNSYNIVKTNKALAQQTKIPILKIIGKKCFKVFADRTAPCPGCQMVKSIAQQKPINFELKHVIGKKHHEVISQPIHDDDGKISGALLIYRDRTEAKMLWEQLLQSEKLASIGLLAGGIAHEINNPLGGIIIFAQMMMREIPTSSPQYQDIVEIEGAAQRCKLIVENLLQFARKSSGSPLEKSDKVNICAALESAAKFALVGQKHKNYVVVQKFPTEPIYIVANKNKTIQLFLNLMQNAIHAMPEGGTLTLKAKLSKKPHEIIHIDIKDTGIGIPLKLQKKIFDPFFTTKGPSEGTGLGLSICHGIVEDMQGNISVQSKLGKGTTFTIMLPTTLSEPFKS